MSVVHTFLTNKQYESLKPEVRHIITQHENVKTIIQQLPDTQTKYIFKTPLTFTIFESGVLTYITFKTALDQE